MGPPDINDAGSDISPCCGHAHAEQAVRRPARGRNWPGPWRKTPGRVLGTSLVRVYQLTLSGFIGNTCRHLPTCSEYAHEAIARHGLWAGGWMALFRVSRCGPWGTSGVDNVPQRLEPGLRWFLPWRYRRVASQSPFVGERGGAESSKRESAGVEPGTHA